MIMHLGCKIHHTWSYFAFFWDSPCPVLRKYIWPTSSESTIDVPSLHNAKGKSIIRNLFHNFNVTKWMLQKQMPLLNEVWILYTKLDMHNMTISSSFRLKSNMHVLLKSFANKIENMKDLILDVSSVAYCENFPSTNLNRPISYTLTGIPSHI